MFTLVTDRSKYYRVKRGQNRKQVEETLLTPCPLDFCGAVIPVLENLTYYSVKPHETYKTISEKFGCGERELREINRDRPLFTTCKMFVPCK